MYCSGRPALFAAVIAFFSLHAVGFTQQTPYVVGSTVSGRVLCADSNAPAHFAKVLLKSAEPDHSGEDFVKELQKHLEEGGLAGAANAKSQTEEHKQAMAQAARSMNRVTDMLNSSTVGLDGSYSFSGVKAGTYYVHAVYAGYIDAFNEFSDEDFASTDPAVRARIAAKIPTVTVTGTDAAHADLRLERGAAVSGRVLYDDGSPASGWTLTLSKAKSTEQAGDAAAAVMDQAMAMSGMAQVSKTDDLGRYRIAGQTAGEYVVRAMLIATPVGISASNMGDGGSGVFLSVYSGNTFNRAEAKTVTLVAGSEHPGIDLTIPANSLHNITGHVYSKTDGHALNMGSVMLTNKSNSALHLTAAIRDDGSFHFEYLPGNTGYTVTVGDAADGRTNQSTKKFMGIGLPDQEILRKYGSDTKDVNLGDADVDNVRLQVVQTDWVPPAKKSGANSSSGQDFQILGGVPAPDSSPKP